MRGELISGMRDMRGELLEYKALCRSSVYKYSTCMRINRYMVKIRIPRQA